MGWATLGVQVSLRHFKHFSRPTEFGPYIGTGKEGNLCEIFYYLVDFFHGLMDMGVVDFMNKNKKKSAKA